MEDQNRPKPQTTLKNDARKLYGVKDERPVIPTERDPVTGRFKKGTTGNPNGRPTFKLADGASMDELFKSKGFEVAEQLWKLINDKKTPPHVKEKALSNWMDRGFGKPKQSIEMETTVTQKHESIDTSTMSLEALRELQAAIKNSSGPVIDVEAAPLPLLDSKPSEDGVE